MSAQLLQGRVWHTRLRPRRHHFIYPLLQIRVPLRGLAHAGGWLLRVDRPGLLSLQQRDHGPRDGSPLLPWIRQQLEARGLAGADGDVWLQTMPRMLGYCFNPISFWFCHDRSGRLRAVLCDVSNTFGGHCQYLVAHGDGRPIAARDWLQADKVLHVSPFFRVQGHYRFRFDGANGVVEIRYDDGEGEVLRTGIVMRERPLADPALIAAVARQGWFTLMVWGRIHLQALGLWMKKVPFHGKQPEPHPQEERR
ncbi:MAG: DUF1365 domain-containing protein [Ectothiorhodospiraceae bacterium]|nr:DUF1365 domain-containing protein [Ectothiorhodospiraceae bacterium]